MIKVNHSSKDTGLVHSYYQKQGTPHSPLRGNFQIQDSPCHKHSQDKKLLIIKDATFPFSKQKIPHPYASKTVLGLHSRSQTMTKHWGVKLERLKIKLRTTQATHQIESRILGWVSLGQGESSFHAHGTIPVPFTGGHAVTF